MPFIDSNGSHYVDGDAVAFDLFALNDVLRFGDYIVNKTCCFFLMPLSFVMANFQELCPLLQTIRLRHLICHLLTLMGQ